MQTTCNYDILKHSISNIHLFNKSIQGILCYVRAEIENINSQCRSNMVLAYRQPITLDRINYPFKPCKSHNYSISEQMTVVTHGLDNAITRGIYQLTTLRCFFDVIN